jgi:Ca2+-binding RTX toxin-like protein
MMAFAGVSPPSASDCTAMGLNVIDHSAASSGQVIRGTRGADCIIGSAFNDRIRGLGGNDVIIGGAGNDNIRAGRGNDIVFGGAGNDNIRGGSGNDTISGGAGNDDLRGNRGNDGLDGGDGTDVIRGGSGNDAMSTGETCRGGGGSDSCDGANRGTGGVRGCRARRDVGNPAFNARVSSSSDRSAGMLLNGTSITGDIYAFISDPSGNLTKVEFILNGRKVFQEMDQAHYDLCGSPAGDSVAYRFPSRYAVAGSNALVFRAHYDSGNTADYVTSFFRP